MSVKVSMRKFDKTRLARQQPRIKNIGSMEPWRLSCFFGRKEQEDEEFCCESIIGIVSYFLITAIDSL